MSFVDESDRLHQATASLPVGFTVESRVFNIDDAMSSIELMIPKMDPGCFMQESLLKSKTIRGKVCDISLNEDGKCRVADILVGQIRSWLSGQLYIQTVHASLFVTEKNNLPNPEVVSFVERVLQLCTVIRRFMISSGVADDEDFVGYMFGFNEEIETEPLISAPQITSYLMCLRIKFIEHVSNLVFPGAVSHDEIGFELEALMSLICEIKSSLHPISEELQYLDETVDPTLHRNLLPSGPPRFVPPVKTSTEIYEEWYSLVAHMKGVLQNCSLATSHPFELMNTIASLRRAPGFSEPFIRSILFQKVRENFKSDNVLKSWLKAACGGSLSLFSDDSSDDLKLFVSDFEMVFNQVIFGLCRSPARQHRSIKKLLANLCVLQHRAWELNMRENSTTKTGFSPSGLWALTAALGTSLIQINLLLNIELDLADKRTEEFSIMFFLLEKASSVKLFVLNNLVSFIRAGRKIDKEILEEIRKQTVIAAAEHSFVTHAFSVCSKHVRKNLTQHELGRIFELRSAPLSTFPLPKSVTFEDYLSESSDPPAGSADECINLIDKAAQLFKSGVEGILLGNDLNTVKKTLIHNKLMQLKANDSTESALEHKYHWIVPCIAKL